MTATNRNALWSLLGLSAFYLAADFWLATQGGDVRLPSPIEIKLGSNAAAVYGLSIVLPTFAAFLYVTHSLLKMDSPSRLGRLPSPFGLEIDLREGLDRRVLAVISTAFMLLPAAAIVHMENKMLSGTVIVSEGKRLKLVAEQIEFPEAMCVRRHSQYGCIVAENWQTHLLRVGAVKPLLSGDYENAFQYDPVGCGKPEGPCKGLTFFPFLGPWLLVLVGVAVLVFWSRVTWLILRPISAGDTK